MRLGEVGQADVAERCLARADQDRRAVEQEPVDQVGPQEGGGRLRTALDEEVVAGEGGDFVGGLQP